MTAFRFANNALRYGAWGDCNAGKVEVTWRRYASVWSERLEIIRCGTTILDDHLPMSSGFGRLICDEVVANALDGTTKLWVGHAGAVWEFDVPVASIVPSFH